MFVHTMAYVSSVTVRVDAATKEAASAVLEGLGLDLSTATRAFYRQIVLRQGLPFDVAYPKEQLRPEIEERFRRAEAEMAGGTGSSYQSKDELFDELGI
jgi:DNA-damage-inducible protein J